MHTLIIRISLVLLSILMISGGTDLYGQKKKGKKKKAKEEVVEPQDGGAKERIDYFFIEAGTQHMLGNLEEALGLYHQVIALDPDNHACYYNVGRISLELGNNDGAVRYSIQAMDLDPSNFWYHALLADAYERLHATDKAIAVLEEITQRFPDHVTSWLNLSQLHARQHHFTKAIEVLNELEKRKGPNEETSLRKFKILQDLDDLEAALIEVETLISLSPLNIQYYQWKYDVQIMKGDPDAANHTLEGILELEPANGFALLALADYYKTIGNYEKSDEFLFKAFKNPNVDLQGKIQILGSLIPFVNAEGKVKGRIAELVAILAGQYPNAPEVLAIQGSMLMQAGKADSARTFFRLALKEDGANESLWQELLLSDSDLNELDVLQKDAEGALEYFPDHPVFLYFFGYASQQLGDYEEAIFAYERAIKIGTPNLDLTSQIHTSLAEIYNEEKEYEKSDQQFEYALLLDPSNALVLNNYAYYLSLRNVQLEKAEKMVKKALEKEPTQSAYMDTYGWILYQLDKFSEAEEWIGKAITSDGGSAEVLEHYGDTWLKLDDKDKAIEYWLKAKEKGGSGKALEEKINSNRLNE